MCYKPEGQLIDTAQNRLSFKSISALTEAMNEGKVLESRAIICDFQHNLHVDMGICKGMIMRTDAAIGIDNGSTRDIAIISRVNKPVCYKIIDINRQENGSYCPILSRRAVQEDYMNNIVSTYHTGDVISARVTHLESFGAFVDIGCGIPSLIPIDAISVSRISHPKDRLSVGNDICVIIKTIDDNGRISLSHKELLGTWEENAALFSAGETVAGIVRSVEEYGVFIELTPNLAGLAEPHANVYPGQHASVYIKSLIPDKMKIKLIIVDAFEASYPTPKPQYFFTGEHIDKWVYSPISSDKLIYSDFR